MSRAARIHRDQVFRRFYDEDQDLVPCYFADTDDVECGGRLQAAHIIAVKVLNRVYSQAVILEDTTGERRQVLDTNIDELRADDRNGVPACERHHNLHEGPVLHCDAPAEFYEFVADHGLEHVIDNARSAA